MNRPRVSTAKLMGLVALVAIECALLTRVDSLTMPEPEDPPAIGLTVLAMGILGLALRNATLGGRRWRSSWAGFFAVAAGYLALCYAPWLGTHIGPRLPTTIAFEDRYLHDFAYTPDRIGGRVWVINPRALSVDNEISYVEPGLYAGQFDFFDVVSLLDQGRRVNFLIKKADSLRAYSPAAFVGCCQLSYGVGLGCLGALAAHRLAASCETRATTPRRDT